MQGWCQSLFATAKVKKKYHSVSTTILADAFCGFIANSDIRKQVDIILKEWLRNNSDHVPTKSVFNKDGNLSYSPNRYSGEADFLWNFIFQGVDLFVTKHNHLHFRHFVFTDGSMVNGMFANK